MKIVTKSRYSMWSCSDLTDYRVSSERFESSGMVSLSSYLLTNAIASWLQALKALDARFWKDDLDEKSIFHAVIEYFIRLSRKFQTF